MSAEDRNPDPPNCPRRDIHRAITNVCIGVTVSLTVDPSKFGHIDSINPGSPVGSVDPERLRIRTRAIVPHYIHAADGKPLAFAAIYDTRVPEGKEPVPTVCMITTEPS